MPTKKKSMASAKTNNSLQRPLRRQWTSTDGTHWQQMAGMQGAAAPAAVSDSLQQFTRFSGNGEALVMHACVPISEVLRSRGVAANGALRNGTSTTAFQSMQLSLTEPSGWTANVKTAADFVSPVFDLISSSFVRYRMRGLRFHYLPQSAATTSERLVFAFAEDPLHPLVQQPVAAPLSSNLLAVADSIPFAPWLNWSMDVSHRLANTTYYTYSDPITTNAFTERFSDFGVIGCVTDTVSATSAIGGVLYMEVVVELLEFCPISVTRPSSVAMAAKLVKRLTQGQATPEDVDSTQSAEMQTCKASERCTCCGQ
jgi:hypothetical protein